MITQAARDRAIPGNRHSLRRTSYEGWLRLFQERYPEDLEKAHALATFAVQYVGGRYDPTRLALENIESQWEAQN